MAQFARPSTDTETNGWVTQAGSASNLFDAINEATADDADYARISSPDGELLKVDLSLVADPQSAAGHVVRYRIGKSGTAQVNMTVALMQGGTEIASWSHSNVGATFTTYAQTLTSAQANAITDYGDLELWISATGDIPGPIAPDTVSGLALWLKADAITGLVNTDPVTTWTDSSGNGLNATGSGTTRPLYQTNVVNGLPVVRFQVDDILTTAANNFGATGAITVFLVAYNIPTGADRVLLEHGANVNTTEGSFNLTRANTNTATNATMRQQSAALYATMEGATATNQVPFLGSSALGARLVGAVFDRSLGQQESTVFVNGLYGGGVEAAITSRAFDNDLGGTFPGTLALNIGNRSGSATLGANGDIGEVVIYNRALTARERTRIDMWLMHKWNLVN